MPGNYRKTVLFMCLDEHILSHTMLHICPQLGVRFLAESNSWKVNGTPNIRTVRQMLEYWDRWLLTMFLHSLAYFFQLG